MELFDEDEERDEEVGGGVVIDINRLFVDEDESPPELPCLSLQILFELLFAGTDGFFTKCSMAFFKSLLQLSNTTSSRLNG